MMGFIVSLFPLACELMGWRGTNGPTVGAAGIGTYFFFGGLLMIIGSVGEVSGLLLLGRFIRANMFAVYHRQYIPLRRLRKLRYVPLMNFYYIANKP